MQLQFYVVAFVSSMVWRAQASVNSPPYRTPLSLIFMHPNLTTVALCKPAPPLSILPDIRGRIQNLTTLFVIKSIELTVLKYALIFEICPLVLLPASTFPINLLRLSSPTMPFPPPPINTIGESLSMICFATPVS
jgi:hypothetical protein